VRYQREREEDHGQDAEEARRVVAIHLRHLDHGLSAQHGRSAAIP
jgi:hypothetical protein